MNESIISKLKQLHFKDIWHVLLFILAVIPSLIIRCVRPHLWLVCETENEARDNGYWFFRYLRLEHPEIDAVYAIRPDSAEYSKVAAYGSTVKYCSLKHWIYYLACEVNASSMKGGKPNAAVGYLLEVILKIYRKNFIFLQHGVIKDDIPSLHAEKCSFSIFCCGAEPEYLFVKDSFGYAENKVKYLGLTRFDGLYDTTPDNNLILIVPTWRMYLQRNGNSIDEEAFISTDYYKAWNGIINDGRLNDLLENYGKHAIFCLHRNMGAFEKYFRSASENIEVIPWQNADIGVLLRTAGVLITDFSSVYMDFAYMYKPIVYYQFDEEEYRSGHLPVGYFSYDRDGFGPVCKTEEAMLAALDTLLKNNCSIEDKYSERIDRFYTVHDKCNCQRTFDAICELLSKKYD